MDYEDYLNITNSTIMNEEVSVESSKRHISHEIVFVIFCSIAFCADLITVYTILKFKRLRTVPNLYIVNWQIMDMLSLVAMPSGYRILSVIHNMAISINFFCVLLHLCASFHFGNIVCVFILIADWCLAAHFRRYCERLRRYYKYVIGFSWSLLIISAVAYSHLCFHVPYMTEIPGDMLFIGYCMLIIIIIIFQFSRAVQKWRRRSVDYPPLSLNLGTIYITCCVTAFIYLLVIQILRLRYRFLSILTLIIAFCNSPIYLIMLYKYDKDFHACFLQVFKRAQNRYENTVAEYATPSSATVENTSVHIHFNNQFEHLISRNDYKS